MIYQHNRHPFILYKYLTKELLQFFLFALFSLIILIFFIDLIELFRRSANKVGVTNLQKANFYDIIGMAGLKIPISLWKIITPGLISFFIIGFISIILINPLSAVFNKKYNTLQTIYFGKKDLKTFTFDTKGFWIKQISGNKQLIINARSIDDINNTLRNVSVFLFDNDKNFQQKFTAKEAKFSKNALNLYNQKFTVEVAAFKISSHFL